ncbi:hypothetical protein [Methylobacterium nodulans]|uniref:Uncharacterized protein n=1 Tax=Methylobacterium nodulans (strain LMG 21967 / CNCM I-2342 / ORS 2060) TaxID=460265 RepID=B8IR52_METNO|nr:hypothetical protein [Methylobacterium nodulans]ACL56754.1 conserved hypothetical protein [Methylobacterium nodulans ORS 2060]
MIHEDHDSLRLSDVHTELCVLRAAAAALDLQHLSGSPMNDLPSVQALIQAAWAVFREFGRDDAQSEPRLN